MSKTQHTPGPWISATAVSSVVGLPVVAQSGRLIANVNCAADPIHGKVPGDDAFNREALINSHLIAAAPDMLDALHHAQEKMWEYGFSEDDLRPVREAILKAGVR